jgi:DNA-binding CsgD family transcriptional regulator
VETIAMTVSFFLLVITITLSAFLEESDPSEDTNVFILLAMVLVGLSVPLNVFSERQHQLPSIWQKSLIAISSALFLLVIFGYFLELLGFLQYLVSGFLVVSIVLSMLFIRATKPKKMVAHRDKLDRNLSIAFILLVPLSLGANYLVDANELNLKVGFTTPLIFILLAGSKLLDDLQRLSLFKSSRAGFEQNFKNYGLTEREKEITTLLMSGKTYQQISEQLFISMPTVKTHASNIYRKCQVKTRSELTALLSRPV